MDSTDIEQLTKRSLPVRGAWIEMAINGTSDYPTESLPVRGAWIEIFV